MLIVGKVIIKTNGKTSFKETKEFDNNCDCVKWVYQIKRNKINVNMDQLSVRDIHENKIYGDIKGKRRLVNKLIEADWLTTEGETCHMTQVIAYNYEES